MGSFSNIDFDYTAMYECVGVVRECAEMIETESKRMDTLINLVTESWMGSGADGYIQYLSNMKSKLAAKAQQLYEIFYEMDKSASEAMEADRLAAEAAKLQNNLVAPFESSSSSSGREHGGGGRSIVYNDNKNITMSPPSDSLLEPIKELAKVKSPVNEVFKAGADVLNWLKK